MKELFTSFWWLVINTGYLILILLISFIAFTVPEQSKDFIYVFLQDFEVAYILAVYISLPIWCFITWYSACIVLQVDPIKGSLDKKDSQRHVDLSVTFPKILGIIPCVIILYAIVSVSSNYAGAVYTLFHILMIGGIAVAIWITFVAIDRTSAIQSNVGASTENRNTSSAYQAAPGIFPFLASIWKLRPLGNWPSLNEVDLFKTATKQDPGFKQEILFICEWTGIRFFYTWLGSFCLLLTLIMCVPSANLFLSSWLRPGAILILSLASFTLLFTIVAYFHDYTRRPFGIFLIVMVIFFSYFNDNTALNYILNNKPGQRLSVDAAFDQWLNRKKENWYKHHPDSVDMPIVFIATQGGGIRGMTWTTRVYHYLDSVHEGFLDQTFVISGVSGGGVGSTAYLSYLSDLKKNKTGLDGYQRFNNFTKRDFLSPVTAAFAFGDNFQRFLPIGFSSLDRSKMLGRTWDEYYHSCTGNDSFSQSFLEMWYPGNDFSIPSLILNGTLAENGQRVVTSNLKISESEWFKDDIDFFTFTGNDISRSTAALNCSRFPMITSGGLMEGGGHRKGHIVDGGYRENTGIQTLLNIYCSIRPRLLKEDRIKIFILYLQNGTDELNEKVIASRVLQDLLVPLQGLIQVNGTGLPAKSIVQFANQMFDKNLYRKVKFFTLNLENRESRKIKLPLGWYMSDTVSKEIDLRVRMIPKLDAAATDTLVRWFPKGDKIQ